MKKFATVIVAAMCLTGVTAASAAGQTAQSRQYAQMQNAQMQKPDAEMKKPAEQSIDSLDMSAVPELDRATVRSVQAALRAKGFDSGPSDGRAGPDTRKAVKGFQDRFGIKATGTIDNQTLFALGIVNGQPAAALAKPEAEPKAEPRRAKTRSTKPARAATRKSIKNREAGAGGGQRWCAYYRTGSTNCGFSTLQQCRATISGIGGYCQPN